VLSFSTLAVKSSMDAVTSKEYLDREIDNLTSLGYAMAPLKRAKKLMDI
jgi:hypothetical protein